MPPSWAEETLAEPLPFRRLPGVYAGAQARIPPRYDRLIDTNGFQEFRVLEPPGVTAIHSPVHDS
jgi:hypothetical protein